MCYSPRRITVQQKGGACPPPSRSTFAAAGTQSRSCSASTPYLIQFAPERWLVHAEASGCHGEPLPSALAAIDESLAVRHLEDATVRIDGRPYRPPSGARRPS